MPITQVSLDSIRKGEGKDLGGKYLPAKRGRGNSDDLEDLEFKVKLALNHPKYQP
jgi:hypothetical protein